MGIMKSLLRSTMVYNALFSILLLLLSAPALYWITQKLYLHQADEILIHKKEMFSKSYLPSFQVKDIATWNRFNTDITIGQEIKTIAQPVFGQQILVDSSEMEAEPYRLLSVPIKIEGKPFTLVLRS